MSTIEVAPGQVRAGDTLVLGKGRTRKVKTVEFCQSRPMCIHIDHECYDVRFSTVTKVDNE